jgi:uroporphyrinogen decarboxylase
MTPHQRFQAHLRFEPVDRVPLMEWGPWDATVERWVEQSGRSPEQVQAYRGQCDAEENAGVDYAFLPPFPPRIVQQDDQTITCSDRMGMTFRQFRHQPDGSMPQFIAPPVRSAEDWKQIKRRLDPQTPGRYPADWSERVERWRREQPIVRFYGFVETYYGGPSLFGFVRMLLGEEQVHYALYDEPALVEDMMETATHFAIASLRRALAEAPITLVQFWEDMAGRNGSLISPDMVRRLMLPRYRRITDVIRAAGVDLIFVDSDGLVDSLIPLWLSAGINGVFPMEQAAGNDVHAYRRRYGRNLLMAGGIDKRALARGPDAIDAELADKIRLAQQGGYIPTLDHAVPPDVSWDHFQHYWRRKRDWLGVKAYGTP